MIGRADGTHLYRGARLTFEGEPPAGPAALRLLFRDGVEVKAEVLESVDGGELALAVPAYRTAAGTEIGAKVWRVARSVAAGAGGAARWVIGERVAPPPPPAPPGPTAGGPAAR